MCGGKTTIERWRTANDGLVKFKEMVQLESPTGIGEILQDSKVKVFLFFSGLMGKRDFDEAEFLVILEANRIFKKHSHGKVVTKAR